MIIHIDESAERAYAAAMEAAIIPELRALLIEQLHRFEAVAREWDGRDAIPCAIDTAFGWLHSVVFDAALEGRRALTPPAG